MSNVRALNLEHAFPDRAVPTVAERKEDISLTLTSATEDVRYRVANAVRSLMAFSAKAAIPNGDAVDAPKSVKILAEVLRNAATLVDSIHELAKTDVRLIAGTSAIVGDVIDLVEACRDVEALEHVEENLVVRACRGLDSAAQVVEKSEEVLDLVKQLGSVELGVNNLGITKDEFRRLAGEGPKAVDSFNPIKTTVNPLEQFGVTLGEIALMKVTGGTGELPKPETIPYDLTGRKYTGPPLPKADYLPRPESVDFGRDNEARERHRRELQEKIDKQTQEMISRLAEEAKVYPAPRETFKADYVPHPSETGGPLDQQKLQEGVTAALEEIEKMPPGDS